MKKLSFILPVYNVEPYLEKCIRSLRDKDMPYKDYEIIVVNDGSQDNSKKLVESLQKEIPNILLINQKNAGVSVARNRGIEVATGEYIVFIDPDDFVNQNLLNRLYKRAKDDNLDILQSGRSLVSYEGQVTHMLGYGDLESKIFDGVTAFHEKDKVYQFFDSSVGYLYKNELVKNNNIQFPIGVVHLEDGVFVRKIFTLAKRVGFENCDFYQVFERLGSASRSKIGLSEKAARGDIKSAKNLLKFTRLHQLDIEQSGFIHTSIIKYTLLPLMRALNAKNINALKNYDRMLINEGLKPLVIDFVGESEYRKYAKIYNGSLWMFSIVYLYKNLKKSIKLKINKV